MPLNAAVLTNCAITVVLDATNLDLNLSYEEDYEPQV
jgi:hypothetical protein